MQSLLFITPELPYPAQSGGKLKSLKLLEHLMTRFEVTLACPLKLEDADYLEAFLQGPGAKLKGHCMQPVHVPRNPVNLGLSYLLNVPLNVFRTRSPALKRRIEGLSEEFDVVLLDHFEVCQYLPRGHTGAVIYHAHNAYHRMWERYSETATNPLMKLASGLEAWRIKRYEVQVCRSADLCFAAPADIDALNDAGVERWRLHETYHLGDDTQLQLPAINFDDTSMSLVYIGFLGWEANVTGLVWFIEEVWPHLRAATPNLQFNIVGKNADPRLQELVARNDGIRLLGFVEDLETVCPTSRVCVAPLTFGSGMKVKVLSGMARGLPVVTTPVGAESIAATHGKDLMISETASDMARDITQLLHDQESWQRLSSNARRLVSAKYTWRSLFQRMDRTMAQSVDSNPESLLLTGATT